MTFYCYACKQDRQVVGDEKCSGCGGAVREVGRRVEQRPACPGCGAAVARAGERCAACTVPPEGSSSR